MTRREARRGTRDSIDRDYRPRRRMTKGILFTDFKPFEGQFGRGSKKLGWLLGRDKNRSVIRRILLRRFYYSETRESADGKCHKVKYVASASQLVFFFFFFFEHTPSTFPIAIEVYIYIYVCTGCPQKCRNIFRKPETRATFFLFAPFVTVFLLTSYCNLEIQAIYVVENTLWIFHR